MTYTVLMLLKVYARVQEIHQPDRQKQYSNLGQSNSLYLVTSALSIYIFCIGGIPQSVVYLSHSDKSVGYQFISHSRPTSNDRSSWARLKNGVLQSVPRSVDRILGDVTSASRGNPNQTRSEASKQVPEHFFAGRKLQSFEVLENRVWSSNKRSAKILEGL